MAVGLFGLVLFAALIPQDSTRVTSSTRRSQSAVRARPATMPVTAPPTHEDDPHEVQGNRRPDVIETTAAFRAFQAAQRSMVVPGSAELWSGGDLP